MNVFYGPAMHEGLRLRRKFRLSYKVNKNDPNPHLAASSHIDFFIITERFIIALSCMLSIIGSLDKDAIYYYAATGTKTTERKSTIQCVKGASTLYSLRSMHPLREIETIESKENEGNHSDSKFKVTNKFSFSRPKVFAQKLSNFWNPRISDRLFEFGFDTEISTALLGTSGVENLLYNMLLLGEAVLSDIIHFTPRIMY